MKASQQTLAKYRIEPSHIATIQSVVEGDVEVEALLSEVTGDE
jgi:DNA-binding transcriptional regulator YdaS (Cro superfamily)